MSSITCSVSSGSILIYLIQCRVKPEISWAILSPSFLFMCCWSFKNSNLPFKYFIYHSLCCHHLSSGYAARASWRWHQRHPDKGSVVRSCWRKELERGLVREQPGVGGHSTRNFKRQLFGIVRFQGATYIQRSFKKYLLRVLRQALFFLSSSNRHFSRDFSKTTFGVFWVLHCSGAGKERCMCVCTCDR